MYPITSRIVNTPSDEGGAKPIAIVQLTRVSPVPSQAKRMKVFCFFFSKKKRYPFTFACAFAQPRQTTH